MKGRGEAMMIYNVSRIQGFFPFLQFSNTPMIVGSTAISQVGKRDEPLSRVPSEEGNEQIQWIWTGMLIELE